MRSDQLNGGDDMKFGLHRRVWKAKLVEESGDRGKRENLNSIRRFKKSSILPDTHKQ